jgi:mono/diheme cytochrome c family protein
MHSRTPWAAFALIGLIFALGACSTAMRDFFRGYAEGHASALDAYDLEALTPAQRGAVIFAVSDFGALNTDTLETHAVPWRLAATALVMRDAALNGGEVSAARIRPLMTRFGFLYPETIGNWPENLPQPTHALETPHGLSLGIVGRDVPRVELTAANLACSSCHAGHTFDATGAPRTDVAWLGAPNTSLDLELYVREIYTAFKAVRGDEERLIANMRTLFPDTSEAEISTIRSFVMPRLQARMDALEANGDRALPFVNGAPGLTNGVAALRMQLGLLGDDAYETARGFTSIPDLGARGFRSSLLYDGAYAPRTGAPDRAIAAADISTAHLDELATVTAFFTVPSMGVHPDRAAAYLDEARDVFAFLRDYQAPRFPGRVDTRLAAQGRRVYAASCASCHGTYDESLENPALVSFPNWIEPYDTDSGRWQVFDASAAEAVTQSAYGDRIIARSTGQYAAPLLEGLWLSAPYLHNGSVPTLWHLMHPSERPVRFQVGGHRLDYVRMGIAGERDANGDYLYPSGYQPWSTPSLIDTRAHGFSNQGHASEFEALSEAQRRALLEYLKLL